METDEPLKEVLDGIIAVRNLFPREQVLEKSITQRQLEILDALAEFMECVRYLNTRRTKGTALELSSEAGVQDALYLMLRPWIKDLKYEDPDQKSGNRYVIKDFYCPSAKTVIEAKYVRDRKHGKDISKELHDDIEMYKQLDECSLIVFFIYDPDGHIPSVKSLNDSICIPRSYDGRSIEVNLIIKP